MYASGVSPCHAVPKGCQTSWSHSKVAFSLEVAQEDWKIKTDRICLSGSTKSFKRMHLRCLSDTFPTKACCKPAEYYWPRFTESEATTTARHFMPHCLLGSQPHHTIRSQASVCVTACHIPYSVTLHILPVHNLWKWATYPKQQLEQDEKWGYAAEANEIRLLGN